MFFIVPIGHDELTVRGLPFATLGLMATLLVVFALTWKSVREPDAGAAGKGPARGVSVETAIDREAADLGVSLEELKPRPAEILEGAPAPGTPFSRRFGFVPSHPGIGLLTHVFIHPGVVSLLIGLVFLWAVAVKLEALWSKPVFVGLFVVGGAVAALVHGALTSSPEAPLLGSAGGVAALMGASLVRLGRSKVYYAYFVWVGLKPKVGTFDAPAYVTPILWLVTVVGAQIAAMAFGSSVGGLSFAAWIGGFAFGCAVAFAFQRAHFEERVLGRAPETVVRPEEMPLVAFQRKVAGARPQGGKLPPSAATIVGIDRAAIRLAGLEGDAFEVRTHMVRVWTVGRIARVTPEDEAALGGAKLRAPAVLLAFVAAAGEDAAAGKRLVVVDAARLRYAELLDDPASTPKEAFLKLTSKLGAVAPGAAFAGDRSRLRTGDLPEHGTVGDFLARLEEADSLVRR